MVICLEQGADLHMAQQMPLPLTVSCFSKIQIGLPFWYRFMRVVLDRAIKRVCVCVCVFRTISAGVTCECWRAALASVTSPTSRTTCAGATTASPTACRSGIYSATEEPAKTTRLASANHTRRPANDDADTFAVAESAVPR